MTDKHARFEAVFNDALGEVYYPEQPDRVLLTKVLEEGTLAGQPVHKLVSTAIKALRAAGSRVTWVTVLKSLIEPYDYKAPAERQRTELDYRDTGRTDLKDTTYTDQLLAEGFSQEEVNQALKRHDSAREAAVEKGEESKKGVAAILQVDFTRPGVKGWELVEEQRSKQIAKSLSTAEAWDKHLEKTGLTDSWRHYCQWKKTNIGKRAPLGVRRIRNQTEFAQWASSGFPESRGAPVETEPQSQGD